MGRLINHLQTDSALQLAHVLSQLLLLLKGGQIWIRAVFEAVLESVRFGERRISYNLRFVLVSLN